MSTFANDMLEARRNMRERCNRGESVGNHGMRPLTAAERREIDPVYASELEAEIAAMVRSLVFRIEQERADLQWCLLENAEPGASIGPNRWIVAPGELGAVPRCRRRGVERFHVTRGWDQTAEIPSSRIATADTVRTQHFFSSAQYA
jgi:hypothetical protein